MTKLETGFGQAQTPLPSQHFTIHGIQVSALSFTEMLTQLLDAPWQRHRLRVHFAAAHTFAEAARDQTLRSALAEADVVAPDGMPVVMFGRLKGHRVERVCGPDMMPAILDQSRQLGYRHFFYGGTPELATELESTLRERFPDLLVAGVYAPPFRPLSDVEVTEVAQVINDARPDYVWVGLGSPQQDLWLASFRPLLKASVLLGVGAAFSFEAGRLKRAPRWAQRSGLEWLFRLAAEPRRMAYRYPITGFRFASLLIGDLLRRDSPAPEVLSGTAERADAEPAAPPA